MLRIYKITILAATMTAALAMAAQDGVTLRRLMRENTSEVYVIESKVQTVVELPGGMGEQEMAFTSVAKYLLKTGRVNDKGVLPVETTTTVEKVEATGMMGEMMGQKPPPLVMKGTIDGFGRMRLDPPKGSGGMAMMMGAGGQQAATMLFVEFPEKPVKIGDAWKVTVPKGPMMKEDQYLDAKLVGQMDVKGLPAWVVEVSGTLKMEMPPTAMPADAGPMAGQKMSMKGTSELKATVLIDKANGRTLELEATAKSKQEVAMEEMGMNIGSTSTATSVVKLQS